MGADALVGLVAIVVVLIEDRGWRFRGKCERVHRYRVHDVDLTGARRQLLAHHAHGQASGAAEIVLKAASALDGAGVTVVLFDPTIHREGPLGLPDDFFRPDV